MNEVQSLKDTLTQKTVDGWYGAANNPPWGVQLMRQANFLLFPTIKGWWIV